MLSSPLGPDETPRRRRGVLSDYYTKEEMKALGMNNNEQAVAGVMAGVIFAVIVITAFIGMGG